MVTLVLLWPGVAASQSARISTNGWRFADTTAAMTDVLVGDIVEGTRLVSGAQVDVKATVRVVRVLDGALAPGTDIQLAWQYTALGPVRPVPGSLSGVRGLWFLRGVAGGFVILRAGELSEGGDYFLELPQGGSGAVIHLPDRSTEGKIAVELAGALQTLAAQEPKGPARLQFRHLERCRRRTAAPPRRPGSRQCSHSRSIGFSRSAPAICSIRKDQPASLADRFSLVMRVEQKIWESTP